MSTRKPVTMRAGSPDDFQTDPWVLEALYPHLPRHWSVWESAAGKGHLSRAMLAQGYGVVSSDLQPHGSCLQRDFFEWEPEQWNVQVTNPPYRPKDQWIARSYALGKPFALLLPLTTFEGLKRQALFREHGLEVIFLPKRPTFTTPVQQKSGGSWFACCWMTWGLNIGQQLTFWDGETLVERPRQEALAL